MANERLNIPDTLKVGFNKRSDTYTGKLAYVTYINNKGEIAKQTSWNGWRDKSIEEQTFENVPMEGFVLNKRAGGYKSGWNFRQTYCRVYDPRGFEFEITMENLLFILQECTSTKGKGLEGEFVYAWSGPELILLPVTSEDYKASKELIIKKEAITIKTLKVGAAYKGKESDYLIYIGKMDWYLWTYCDDKDNGPKRYYGYNYWKEVKKVTLPTFVDVKENKFRGYKNMSYLDFLIEENVIEPCDVEDYKDKYKKTPAYRTQFVNGLTIGDSLKKWENFKGDNWPHRWYHELLFQKPGEKDVQKINVTYVWRLDGLSEYEYMNKYTTYGMSTEERAELKKRFLTEARRTFKFSLSNTIKFENGKLTDNYVSGNHEIKLTDDDWKYISDSSNGYPPFTAIENGVECKVYYWPSDSKSVVSINIEDEE